MSHTRSYFVWYELTTNDIDAAQKFYGDVIGWKTQDSGTPGMDYRQWTMGGTPIGGLMSRGAPPPT